MLLPPQDLYGVTLDAQCLYESLDALDACYVASWQLLVKRMSPDLAGRLHALLAVFRLRFLTSVFGTMSVVNFSIGVFRFLTKLLCIFKLHILQNYCIV